MGIDESEARQRLPGSEQGKEGPSAARIEKVLQKAATLERFDPNNPLHEKAKTEPQFGNNFYLLFEAMRVRPERPDAAFVEIYLGRAESFGEPWARFLSSNQNLIDQILLVLADREISEECFKIFRDFYEAQNPKGAHEFENRLDPRLGAGVIGMPILSRLNPLLKQAAEAMRGAGIDPKQFYG